MLMTMTTLTLMNLVLGRRTLQHLPDLLKRRSEARRLNQGNWDEQQYHQQ
jgi:hypothetical protein